MRDPLVSNLVARVCLAIGALLVLLILLSSRATVPTVVLSVFAAGSFSFGIVLLRAPDLVPLVLLDGLLTFTDCGLVGLAVLFGDTHNPLVHAYPGLYLLIGMIVFAVRSWRAVVGHTLLLGVSYAGVLTLGPAQQYPVLRWFLVLAVIISSGLLIRWLTSSLEAVAASERAARATAEMTTAELLVMSEAKTVFLSQISHELRTPLNVMKGFADLVADGAGGSLSEAQLDCVNDIRESTHHLADLVEDVLDITVIESGGDRLTVDTIDVRTAVTEAVRLLRESADARQQTIRVEIADEVVTAVADRVRLRQVLVNLLSNAIKYTSSGGQITLTAARRDGRVVFSVRDTGQGIDEIDRERIFEKFARSASDAEGTGLGLPLARQLVELHGGTLSVQSTLGEGSTFTFDIPTTMADLPQARPLPVEPAAANPAVITGPVSPEVAQRMPFPAAVTLAGLAAVAWTLIDVVPLWNTALIIVMFALSSRRRGLAFLVWVGLVDGIAFAITDAPDRWKEYVTLLVVIGFVTAEVDWLVGRVRLLVRAERWARQHADQSQSDLIAASRHKSAFIANMSHELRTPLNAIIGFGDLLAEEIAGPLSELQRSYLADVTSSARNLLAIINDVLDVATLEAGRVELDVRQVATRDLIERAVAAASDETTEAVTDIVVGDGAATVCCDPHRIEQGLAHLISNAMKFTQPGDPIQIEATADPVTHQVTIAVSDTGTGIAADDLGMIFEPFHQGIVQPVRQGRGGAGLGLSLAQALVQLHGGSLTVTSAPGSGSTFRMSLPN